MKILDIMHEHGFNANIYMTYNKIDDICSWIEQVAITAGGYVGTIISQQPDTEFNIALIMSENRESSPIKPDPIFYKILKALKPDTYVQILGISNILQIQNTTEASLNVDQIHIDFSRGRYSISHNDILYYSQNIDEIYINPIFTKYDNKIELTDSCSTAHNNHLRERISTRKSNILPMSISDANNILLLKKTINLQEIKLTEADIHSLNHHRSLIRHLDCHKVPVIFINDRKVIGTKELNLGFLHI